MTNRMQPKCILIVTPHYGDCSAFNSILDFLLPALHLHSIETHLITSSLTNIYYRGKGVYVYSSDHSSITALKKLPYFSAGFYFNVDRDQDVEFQNEFHIHNWISIDNTEFQPLLDVINKHEYNKISLSVQSITTTIVSKITTCGSKSNIDDSTQSDSNIDYNVIAPFFEISEEGELSREIFQHSRLHQIHINPVCIPSFLNLEINIQDNQYRSTTNNLIIFPSYYSQDEVKHVLKLYNHRAPETYVLYPSLEHIQSLLENNASIILSSNYLKHKLLDCYGEQYNKKILVLHKSIDVPTDHSRRKYDETIRFITIISNHSDIQNLDYLCTSFIDLLKDSDNFELHICFLSNAHQSETYHYYNNLFTSKQTLVCHYCDRNDADYLMQTTDCYISINTTGCFDIYTLKAVAYEVPVMTVQHEITFEYFDQKDILTYEFETESIRFDQNNNITGLKHTVRKESIATELNRFIQHKDLIQTKIKSVKRALLSLHNMDAWFLSFEYHVKNKGGG